MSLLETRFVPFWGCRSSFDNPKVLRFRANRTLNYEATILAAGTVVIMVGCRLISNRIPGPIVALVLGTAAVVFLHLPVETIGTRFGGIPSGLPICPEANCFRKRTPLFGSLRIRVASKLIPKVLIDDVRQGFLPSKPFELGYKETHRIFQPLGRVIRAVRRQQDILHFVKRMPRG